MSHVAQQHRYERLAGMRKVVDVAALLLVTALGLTTAGCASLKCGVLVTGGGPTLELAYFSAGDGPTATSLRFFSGSFRRDDAAVLEVEPIGQRRRCHKVVGPEILELKELLKSESFQARFGRELAKGNDAGIHQAFLSIEHYSRLVQRRPEILSPRLLDDLYRFEALFSREFPRLIEWYLPFSIEDPDKHDATE